MAFNINEFVAEVNKTGLAKNNLFEVILTGPVTSGASTRLLCKSVNLPGVEIETQSFRPHGYGPDIKRPMNFALSPVRCVFMVDGAMEIKTMFHKWVQLVLNYDNTTMSAENQGIKSYEMGYMRDYAGSLTVKIYPVNEPGFYYEYRYGNVYPISLGEIDMAWENGTEILTMPVSFAYNIFSNDGIKKA